MVIYLGITGILTLLGFLYIRKNPFEKTIFLAEDNVFALVSSFSVSVLLALIVYRSQSSVLVQINEYVAGAVVYNGMAKDRDYISLAVFIVATILCLSLFQFLFSNLAKSAQLIKIFRRYSPYIVFPSVLILSQSILSFNLSILLYVSVGLIISFYFNLLILKLRRKSLATDEEHLSLFKKLLFTDVMSFFAANLLRYLIFRFLWKDVDYTVILLAVLSITKLVFIFDFSISKTRSSSLLFVFMQIFLVSSFVVLANPDVEDKISLKLIVLVIIGFSIYKTIKDFRRSEDASLSGIVVFSMLFMLVAKWAPAPLVSTDGYHSGEYYLPFWQLIEFGKLPFIDLQPARGMLNYLPGFLAELFFDGTMTSYPYTENIQLFIIMGVCFAALKLNVGKFWSFTLLTLYSLVVNASPMAGTLLGFAFYSILLYLYRNKSHLRTLIVYFVGSLVLVPLMVAEGTLFVIAVVPIALKAFIDLLNSSERKKLFIFLGSALFVIAALLILPLTRNFYLSVIRYLLGQSSINTAVHGLQFVVPSIGNSLTRGFFWQFIRFSWVLIPASVFYVIFFKKIENKREIFISLLPMIILAVLYIPRAAGRIDNNVFSRPFFASYIVVPISIVIIEVLINKNTNFLEIKKLIYLNAVLFGIWGVLLSPSELLDYFINQPLRYTTENSEYVAAEDTGFENIGNYGYIDSDQLQRQINIRQALNYLLDGEETFFNATSNSSDYMFQNVEVPTVDPAPYNMAHPMQQQDSIERLLEGNVEVVLLWSDNFVPDVKLPLRNPLMYNFLVENYFPIKDINGYLWMVTPEKYDDVKQFDNFFIELETLNDKIYALDHYVGQGNLMMLPAVWGNSHDYLSNDKVSIEMPVEEEMSGYFDKNLYTVYFLNITKEQLSELDSLYLAFEDVLSHGVIDIYLDFDDNIPQHHEHFIRFNAIGNRFTIPLWARSAWLLNDSNARIFIIVDKHQPSIDEITLFNAIEL